MQIGLEQVGAHYAISSIFRAYPNTASFSASTSTAKSGDLQLRRGRVAVGALCLLPHH
jgi:hypothetical protein